MRRVLHRILFVMPFVLPTWILAWWIGHGAAPAQIFILIVALPSAFVIALVMALLVWVRPDAREQRALTWPDTAWIAGTWLAWLVGGALAGVAGIVAMVVAFWIGIAGIVWLWRRLRRETSRRLDELARTADARRRSGGAGRPGTDGAGQPGTDGAASFGERGRRGPGGPAQGPDAGKVITVHPSTPSRDASGDGDRGDGASGDRGDGTSAGGTDGASRDRGDGTSAGLTDGAGEGRGGRSGRMPGSARIDGAVPRVDDARPGVNFGANRAPVAADWDSRRPVPGAPGAAGGEDEDAAREQETPRVAPRASRAEASGAADPAGGANEVDDDEWAGPGARR